VSRKALVADTVPPEVLAGLSEADPVRSAFVGRIFELNVVVVPPTHGACLKRPRRRLSKGLVAAAWAGMLVWARRNWAPVELALCHCDHDGRPSEGSTPPVASGGRRHPGDGRELYAYRAPSHQTGVMAQAGWASHDCRSHASRTSGPSGACSCVCSARPCAASWRRKRGTIGARHCRLMRRRAVSRPSPGYVKLRPVRILE
jgi:hypothetical protein